MTAPPSEKSTAAAPAPSAGAMVSGPAPDAVSRPRRSALVTMTGPSRLPTSALFPGPGQVSLVWAVQRQLFERGNSGSPLRPDSRAYMAVADWLQRDGVLHFLGARTLRIPLSVVQR